MSAIQRTRLLPVRWQYWLIGLIACLAGGWSLGGGSLRLVAFMLALGILILIVAIDARLIAGGSRPLAGFIVLFGFLPFSRLVFPGDKYFLLWQGLSCGLLVVYLLLLPREECGQAVRRVKPVLAPIGLFMGVLSLAYVLSPGMARSDLYYLLNMWSAMAYAGLAAVFCRSLRETQDMIAMFVACGMLQSPVILSQAMGWSRNLPGALSQLSPDAWGGSLDQSSGYVRYPGSFGDYELLAEYFAILFILSLGSFLYSRSGTRRILMFCCVLAFAGMGWLTGTRAFLVGAVIGGVLLPTLGAIDRRGGVWHRWRPVAVVLGVAGVISVVLPKAVTFELLSRLTAIDFLGPNYLNRGLMFSTWVSLSERMPFMGYGTRMLEVARAAFPMFLVYSPHSLYFSMLLIAGYLGLVAAILLAVAVFLQCAGAWICARAAPVRRCAMVLTVAVFFWALDEVKIEFLRSVSYADFLLAVFGVVSSLWQIARPVHAPYEKQSPVFSQRVFECGPGLGPTHVGRSTSE